MTIANFDGRAFFWTLGCLSLLQASPSFSGATVAQDVGPAVEAAPVIELGRPAPAAPDRAHEVDLAICLDTSGSMQGLIEAAKQKLWAIVNDFALARPMPKLRVALLTYGNNGHLPENGWVEIQTPFTEDLDLVSQRLFALSTNGGEEYVGRVVNRAVQDLAWTTSSAALKVIVVAGNESADQDQVLSFRTACAGAIGRDILVNAIYCGNPLDEIAPGWREVARLADGQFAAIDHDQGTVVVATPFDAELTSLGTLVNSTYVPLGAVGLEGWQNQAQQDANAASLNSEAAALRAQTKGQALYVCSWDLVSACLEQKVQLAEVKLEDLPAELQAMTLGERESFVQAKAAERTRIQQRIAEVSVKRQAWVDEELRKNASDPSRSFDFALRRAIREQAERRGICFEDPARSAADALAWNALDLVQQARALASQSRLDGADFASAPRSSR